ncbi:PEGA domain-containing protein [Methanoregula sp.]|uniref:PEGA domain-containing protein n=1 Tax=Methanoregula sp. TaxID=2052170 RepID=UPI000CC1EE93|nr:PEGA domain-containing protein [Methanoregula sp.]PKG32027.1 MAG: hypothetical protein CW742_10315 [Methanoregula sp.]
MHSSSLKWGAFLVLLLLVPCVTAFSVSSTTVDPAILNPGDSVNMTTKVYVASGTPFSAFDDLRFVTTLDDPVWVYTVIIGGVENTRPADRGKILTIGGYELSYPAREEVVVDIALKGLVPAATPEGTQLPLITVQELDAKSRVITSSVIEIKHLVGMPTPTPTPEYGQIVIASEPPGANVFLDNSLRGITPVTLKAVSNGRHTVTLRLEGYEDAVREVIVTADSPQVSVLLAAQSSAPSSATSTLPVTAVPETPGSPQSRQAAATTGSLSITTTPPGALVFIDGQMKGISPATIPGLAPGQHKIRLVLDGYQDFETITEIAAGSTSEFVTGLSTRKQVPGFEAIPALAAVGVILLFLCSRKRDL